MATQNTNRKIQWLPILLIIWNIIDIAVHVAVDMVEPLRISGNVIGLIAAGVVLLGLVSSYQPAILVLATVLIVILSTVHSALHGFVIPMLVFVGGSVFLLLRLAQVKIVKKNSASEGTKSLLYKRWWVTVLATLIVVAIVPLSGQPADAGLVSQFHNGELQGADYWRDEPMILSAGMGFDNIVGLPEVTEETVREVGGSWYGSLTCANGEEPDTAAMTSATASSFVSKVFKGVTDYDDGLPIVFSWPVATETVDVSDFQFTLNTGEVVFPNSAGMWPNWELNERNVVVVFGDFGNRGLSNETDVIFPVQLEIVADDTPLLLIGPEGGVFNAVGLTWETDTTPYESGPVLVGAKLNAVGEVPPGEGGVRLLEGRFGPGFMPNDEFALYDGGDFRIRVLTSGGFSPDGVTGVRPDMYEQFFRVHANGVDGETVILEQVGQDYVVAGGTLRVVGLSDLGQKENPNEGIYYNDCYVEDRDNYIDIILVGDEAAARNITFVEIPALEGGYRAFYNPGGPGPEPFEGVRYTAPGPADMEPVIIALDNPMRIDRQPPSWLISFNYAHSTGNILLYAIPVVAIILVAAIIAVWKKKSGKTKHL